MQLKKRKVTLPIDGVTKEAVLADIAKGKSVKEALYNKSISPSIRRNLLKEEEFISAYEDYKKLRAIDTYETSVEDVQGALNRRLETSEDKLIKTQKEVLANAKAKYDLAREIAREDGKGLFSTDDKTHLPPMVNINIATDPGEDKRLVEAFSPVIDSEGTITNKPKDIIHGALKNETS